MNNSNNTADKKTAYYSTFAIGGVSCSADGIVVAESFVLKNSTFANLQNVNGNT